MKEKVYDKDKSSAFGEFQGFCIYMITNAVANIEEKPPEQEHDYEQIEYKA